MPVHQCTPVSPSDGTRRQSSSSVNATQHQHSNSWNTQAHCHRPTVGCAACCGQRHSVCSLTAQNIRSLKVLLLSSVHTTCPRAVSTARGHGCPKWYPCSLAALDTLVTNTAREHGCHFLTLVFTGHGAGRVHGRWTYGSFWTLKVGTH